MPGRRWRPPNGSRTTGACVRARCTSNCRPPPPAGPGGNHGRRPTAKCSRTQVPEYLKCKEHIQSTGSTSPGCGARRHQGSARGLLPATRTPAKPSAPETPMRKLANPGTDQGHSCTIVATDLLVGQICYQLCWRSHPAAKELHSAPLGPQQDVCNVCHNPACQCADGCVIRHS